MTLKDVEKNIIATDNIAGTEYEFKIAGVSDPDCPQMTHQVVMREKCSDGYWESSMTGLSISRKDALRHFAERYYRVGDIEKINVLDEKLRPFVDEQIQQNKEKERAVEKAKEEYKKEQEIEEKNRMKRAENEQTISEEMKKAKAKKTKIKIKTDQGGGKTGIVEMDACLFGDYAYHRKYASNSKNYVVTHIPSGYLANHNRKLNLRQAKELAYRFSKIPERFSGNGEPSAKFKELGKKAIQGFEERTTNFFSNGDSKN